MILDENLCLKSAVQAILFAVGQAVELERLAMFFEKDQADIKQILDEISDDLRKSGSGVMLSETDGAYRLCTNDAYGDVVAFFMLQKKTQMLSNAALEVLAVAAYNQPSTKTYISQVRGVNSAEIVDNLVEKGLLEQAGRLDLPGRPMAYATTNKFLTIFGLTSLDDLPPAESFLNPEITLEEAAKNSEAEGTGEESDTANGEAPVESPQEGNEEIAANMSSDED